MFSKNVRNTHLRAAHKYKASAETCRPSLPMSVPSDVPDPSSLSDLSYSSGLSYPLNSAALFASTCMSNCLFMYKQLLIHDEAIKEACRNDLHDAGREPMEKGAFYFLSFQ